MDTWEQSFLLAKPVFNTCLNPIKEDLLMNDI